MRYALAITSAAVLFVLGLVVAACGSSSGTPTTAATRAGPPYASQLRHQPGATGTRTTVTTVGYLDTNGSESTATFTYTTVAPKSSITFTRTAGP